MRRLTGVLLSILFAFSLTICMAAPKKGLGAGVTILRALLADEELEPPVADLVALRLMLAADALDEIEAERPEVAHDLVRAKELDDAKEKVIEDFQAAVEALKNLFQDNMLGITGEIHPDKTTEETQPDKTTEETQPDTKKPTLKRMLSKLQALVAELGRRYTAIEQMGSQEDTPSEKLQKSLDDFRAEYQATLQLFEKIYIQVHKLSDVAHDRVKPSEAKSAKRRGWLLKGLVAGITWGIGAAADHSIAGPIAGIVLGFAGGPQTLSAVWNRIEEAFRNPDRIDHVNILLPLLAATIEANGLDFPQRSSLEAASKTSMAIFSRTMESIQCRHAMLMHGGGKLSGVHDDRDLQLFLLTGIYPPAFAKHFPPKPVEAVSGEASVIVSDGPPVAVPVKAVARPRGGRKPPGKFS